MCCFSLKVQSVSDTNIFARGTTGNRQIVVYHMHLRAKDNLAMILPIPVARPSKENAVKFINLKDYPGFFTHLNNGFPRPAEPGRSKTADTPTKAERLAVVEVGDFEASFVPTVADFNRLDERFRLPTETWKELPAYKHFGFAVFKLEPGGSDHPMAFEFPRAKPETLFFPTVHIHDGEVHPMAGFDHRLYCQAGDDQFRGLMHWQESPKPAVAFMNMEKADGIVDPAGHCYLKEIHGRHKNEDVVLA